MARIPTFDDETLRAICNVLGDTSNGLTGAEIGQLLHSCQIEDLSPSQTKRYRLFDALAHRQHQDRCGSLVIAFMLAAMSPVRYTSEPDVFEIRRSELNQVLSFHGLQVAEDGQLRRTQPAHTLSQARERATRLHRALASRGVHPDVLRFCRAELLQDNYFHAVFEATKSVADKIREVSGLTDDGALLVDRAFGGARGGLPLLALNTLQTPTEINEHNGIMNLLKGLFGMFRNTTAHAPRISWVINEQDALDVLSLASLLHRRLDGATRTRP